MAFRKRKLGPNHEKFVFERAAEGDSAHKIADEILQRFGITISHQRIGQILLGTRVARSEAAKAVIHEKLAPIVVQDLDRLIQEQERVGRLSTRLHKRANACLDTMDKIDRHEPVTDAEVQAAGALMGNAGLADLAMKASDRVMKLAQTKLHLSGADETPDTKQDANGTQELWAKLDRLADRVASEGGAGAPATRTVYPEGTA